MRHATDDDEPCPTCGGTGYLANQTYGFAVIPNGWIPVQACDNCSVFPDDEAAARQAGRDNGSNSCQWCPADDDEPGDYAVIE
jgi:hypothetical protein